MKDLAKIINKIENEKIKQITELKNRSQFANRILDEVYQKRETELKEKELIIQDLLEKGDVESFMNQLTQVNDFMAQTPEEEIKMRLSEYESEVEILEAEELSHEE